MEFTSENLEHAVAQFYHSDAGMQAQAHKWLTEAQNSPQAWCFVWQLLCPNKSAEVQFFAATTLHTKVVKSWLEVPVDQYPTLKQQLLESIVSYSLGPKIVLNRLCIALSAFILHTLPTHWPNAIGELLAMLQPANLPTIPAERTAWILLQILTVLPEEFQSSHIDHAQKTLVRNELHNNIPQVVSLLEDILSSDVGSSSMETAYEVCHQGVLCAAAWLQLGVALPDCEGLADRLIAITFTATALQNQSTALAESALDALVNMATHVDTHHYPGTLLKLVGKLLPLHSIVIQQQQRRELADQDLVNNVYSLFISIAESHSRLLLDMLLADNADKHNVLQLIETVLQCSNSPGRFPIHETTSQLPMGFWYILQDDMLASDPEQARLLLPLLVPVYRALATVMLHKAMLPEADEEWTIEDKEALRCYRQDVADTMMYCYSVLRDGLLELLYTSFQDALSKCQDEGGGGNVSGWARLESCLHGLFAIAECSDAREEKYLPLFLTAIQRLPFDRLDPRLADTALNTLGAYAEWINVHPDMLTNVIPLLVMGLGNPHVAPSATMALKDLTRDCQISMAPFAHLILQASQEALRNGHLKLNECVRLMYTVGRVLAVLPLENIMNYLNLLLMPYVEELQQLVALEPSTSTKAAILLRLKMVSMLFATLDVKPRPDCDPLEIETEDRSPQQPPSEEQRFQPVFPVLERILPVLQAIGLKWCGDVHVVQAVCAVLKHALCTLMEDSRPLLPDMLDVLLKSYQTHPNPASLDLARQFVVFYGRDEPALMRSLLSQLTDTTLRLVGTARPPSELSNHTTVLESYFNLLAQVVKKSPDLLAGEAGPPLAAVFTCATETLAVQEAPTVKAAASFIVNFIAQSREIPSLVNVVQQCGEMLVLRVLSCVGGESPRFALDPMADILLALNKKYCDNLCRWLQQTTQAEGFPSQRATRLQTQTFVKAVLRERANKRKLQETVRAFSFLCRGILSTEYGTQPTLSF